MLKYSPKVYLKFLLPDGSAKSGFFRQSQKLGDIIASFGAKGTARLGKRRLDQDKSIAELGLKHDDVIEVK